MGEVMVRATTEYGQKLRQAAVVLNSDTVKVVLKMHDT